MGAENSTQRQETDDAQQPDELRLQDLPASRAVANSEDIQGGCFPPIGTAASVPLEPPDGAPVAFTSPRQI